MLTVPCMHWIYSYCHLQVILQHLSIPYIDGEYLSWHISNFQIRHCFRVRQLFGIFLLNLSTRPHFLAGAKFPLEFLF